ncbi:hypothetical protein J7M22_08330 [Candidatus Poribacteria bacterium]|nr:hypothetical protein [Candidatus Poribacteria bacterium]
MARSEARRQKKLMKKRRKDKMRRKRKQGIFPDISKTKMILNAREYPIHECLINSSWREQGIASILLSRRQLDGRIVFGLYLVDIFCLGLKDTFCNADVSLLTYEREVKPRAYSADEPVECPIPLAHSIIYGGIEYAERLGFKPHRDFKLSKHILEEPDKIERVEVEFGKDGKPFYISGPHDDLRRIKNVIKQLEERVGSGNYEVLIRLGDETEVMELLKDPEET